MPLFGTEYASEIIPETMGFQAELNGAVLVVMPHLCECHIPEDSPHDHRGFIDLTLIQYHPIIGVPIPQSSAISLDMASALIEGLQAVGPYVQMNAEAEEGPTT